MISGYLLDEQLPKWWRREIIRHAPGLAIWKVGDPQAPPLQAPDPVLLAWCEARNCLLLTNNRHSMPGHLAEHVRQGRQMPGIFVLDPKMNVARLAYALELIAAASFESEYQNQINYFPLL